MIVSDKKLNKILIDKYHQIIPSQEDGLVVFNLHNKISKDIIDKTFSERAILTSIQTVYQELGVSSLRELTQKNDETIHRLLKHFIERIPEGRGYKLTTYADTFCNVLNDEAFTHINPTELEQIFKDLVTLLKAKLTSLTDFNHWYNFQFSKNKNDINGQVRALKMQIDETVETLNEIVKNEADDFKLMLMECDKLLGYIKEQTDRLSTAFSAKDDIKQMLDEADILTDEAEFRDRKRLVREFFKDIEEKLLGISSSIDRIRPRINKLYSDFEKREFDRKLEVFLLFLFKNSEGKFVKTKRLKDRTVNEIRVKFPKPLPSMKKQRIKFEKEVYFSQPKFTQIEYYNLLDPLPMDIENVDFDAEDLQRQMALRLRQMERDQRVEHWFKEIDTKLNDGKKVEFANYFYKILEQEKDLETAIKEAHMMVKEYAFSPKYTLKIDEKFMINDKQKNIAIWKMQIQQNTVS